MAETSSVLLHALSGNFLFFVDIRALFLFTRPGLAAFIRILVYGDAFGPFPIALVDVPTNR